MVYYGVMTGDTSRPGYEELAAENAALRQRVGELSQRVVELEAALKGTLEQLETARRAGKRQAAPFSKGPPKSTIAILACSAGLGACRYPCRGSVTR